ncbi:MAG: hypothetical protein CM15mP77_3210 [Synechococcus sp.]|nr:MAG: hypothetical protein CM15mP77_3210 [Synechococcus sp.]
MLLEQVLHASVRYPLLLRVRSQHPGSDGAPWRALVIMAGAKVCGCLVCAVPLGFLGPQGGQPSTTRSCSCLTRIPDSGINSIRQIAPSQLEEVAEFFRLTEVSRGVASLSLAGEMRVLSRHFSTVHSSGQLILSPPAVPSPDACRLVRT